MTTYRFPSEAKGRIIEFLCREFNIPSDRLVRLEVTLAVDEIPTVKATHLLPLAVAGQGEEKHDAHTSTT